MEQSKHTFLGIEILRFISALVILIYHYWHFSYAGLNPVGLEYEKLPFYKVFGFLYDHGVWAVQVFWCISGFIFFWQYLASINSGTISGKTFFILRFSRLYPLHLATLLIVLLLQLSYIFQMGSFFVYPHQDIQHFILQLFFYSNWGTEHGLGFNGPVWSVSVELLIYCTFFLVSRLAGKSLWINALVLGAYVIFRDVLNITSVILDCLAYFYMGGVVAIVTEKIARSSNTKLYNRVCVFILMVAPLIAYALKWYLGEYSFGTFLLIYVPFLLYFAAQEITVPRRLQPIITAAGNMTYSSYLMHFPLQLLTAVCFAYAGMAIPFYNDGFFLFYIAVVLVASYFTYRCFEKPAQDFIRRKWL